MGVWLVGADVLARSRFRTSALAETVAALLVLLGAPARPGRRDVARHRAAFRARLAADPVTEAFARAAVTAGWLADVLCVPPDDDDHDIADELARIRRTPADAVVAGLAPGRARPPELGDPGLGDRVADLLGWVWGRAVAPDWPRLARAFEADIVARTRRLSTGGWAAALGDLRHGTRWLGDGRLQINAYDHPPRDLAGAQLLFIPAVTANGWAGWAPPHRYSIVYPCGGLLAGGPAAVPGTLSRLLGPGRAAILAALAAPMSTTQLVAVTGHGLGSVGNHLRVLLDAGLVRRRRAGRSVLYYRTDEAERLLRVQR